MVAPIATDYDDSAMLWQRESGMYFEQVGGYQIHPAPDHSFSEWPYTLTLNTLFKLLNGQAAAVQMTPEVITQARHELAASHADAFIVPTWSKADYPILLSRATTVIGRVPDRNLAGVALWDLSGSDGLAPARD
jgi:hypothetical protein